MIFNYDLFSASVVLFRIHESTKTTVEFGYGGSLVINIQFCFYHWPFWHRTISLTVKIPDYLDEMVHTVSQKAVYQ